MYRCAESCREYFFLFWKLHFGSSNLNNWAQGTVALHRTQHLSYRNIETVDRELGELASCVFVCVCVFGVEERCQNPPSPSCPEGLLQTVRVVGKAGMCRHVWARVKLLLNTASTCPTVC